MKIIFVCSSFGGGGAERAAVNLANCFSLNGHQVTFFYWDKRKSIESYTLAPKVVRVEAPYRFVLARLISLVRVVFSVGPDWVISFTDIPNILSVAAARVSRTSVCVTVHSDLRMRDGLSKRPRSFFFLRALHRWACGKATHVVAVSEGVRQSLAAYYRLPVSGIDVIYNPVLSAVRVEPRMPSAGDVLKIVAMGRLTAAKNYPLMFEAVAEIARRRPVHLTIYGEGESRRSLEDLIARMDIRGLVSMPGFQPDVAARLSHFDVFLMTSRWEGFGNVLIEALNAGLPIVSTDCPSGPAEALGFGKYGRLVAEDPAQIADAVMDVIGINAGGSETLRKHLGVFTTNYACAEYLALLTGKTRPTENFHGEGR